MDNDLRQDGTRQPPLASEKRIVKSTVRTSGSSELDCAHSVVSSLFSQGFITA